MNRKLHNNLFDRGRTMNGPIAQIVALTCFGNAFLAERPINQFFPANSTCQFCEKVAFVTLDKSFFGKQKETLVASSPDAWFTYIKKRGAIGIRLARSPQDKPGISDRMSAGFVGGGGTWTMEVLFPRKQSEFWIARWDIGDQNAQDKRIWRVTYGRVAKGNSTPDMPVNLQQAVRELAESLNDIRAFSTKHNLNGFTKWFDEALDTISSDGKNRHGYHQDLAPSGVLSEEAALLLDASQKSWVFGGMGSWNDMGFEGEDREIYDRVSERLFQTVNEAIEQAASSTIELGRISR